MRIALISGASKGIGYEISKLLDNECLDEIWLIARNKGRLVEISKEFKTTARIFPLDLTKNDAFEKFKTSLNESISIEYLVCSAGVGYNGNFSILDETQIANMIDLNILSLTLLTRCALPYMAKGGKIIQIASSAGFMPQPGFAVYSATKSYVISFSRAINRELKKDRVCVTAVCPGPVDTDFFASLENVKEYKKKHLISPKRVAIGAIRASKRGRSVYTPTFSMKLVHLASKILPTSLILKLYKS